MVMSKHRGVIKKRWWLIDTNVLDNDKSAYYGVVYGYVTALDE